MTPSGTRRWKGRLRRCWMGSKLSIGYMRQLRRDPPLRAWPREGGRQTSTWGLAMAGAGHQVGAAQGGRHQGPPESEGPQKGLRFQVASLKEEWWVKVGTYGMASAQSYWGRLAALLLRVLYALFPQVGWNFVFVDDFLWLLRSEGAVNLAVALLATLLALGTPLSWKKTHLAEVNTWLGFVVHPNIPQVLMAANKHILVMEVLQTMVEGQAMHSKDIEKALGRIQWATAACPLAKSMLNLGSKKPYTAAILMELVFLLHTHGCSLAANHVPRKNSINGLMS